MKSQYKRKNFFINRTFQGRYIFQFYGTVLLGALIFSIVLSYFSVHSVTISYEDYHLKVDSTPFMLWKQMIMAHWVVFIPLGIGVAILGIFQTHRIAGPLFKLEQVLERMAQGNIQTNVGLRPRDDGKGVFKKLNLFNTFLLNKLGAMQKHTLEAKANIEALSKNHEVGDLTADQMKNGIEAMRQSLEKIEAELHVFHIQKK